MKYTEFYQFYSVNGGANCAGCKKHYDDSLSSKILSLQKMQVWDMSIMCREGTGI